MNRTVTLCNIKGRKTGIEDSFEAHVKGLLHLAFSVYLFDPDRTKLLIQKRSRKKMLWPGIWANTCCSHLFENETAVEAGERRLFEELGMRCPLISGTSFVYRSEDPAGRGTEHEHVTLLSSTVSDSVMPKPDPDEVEDWKWIEIPKMLDDFKKNPDIYAPWLKIGFNKIFEVNNLAI